MIDSRVETFLWVCKTMNYTRAAEELSMTQPSVSQHIRYLEEFYKVKLFNYQNKKLELTEQGLYLKKYLETLSHDVKYIRESMQNIKKTKRIKLGATLSIGEFYIPDTLSNFLKLNSDIEISVTIADTRDLLSRLDCGDVDLILCEGYFDKNQYAYKLIKKDDMCIVCSSEYKYQDIRDLNSLFSHHILIRENGSGTRDIFENYLRDHGFSLNSFVRVSEFTSPHLIKKLLLDNLGISVFYKTVLEVGSDKDAFRIIELPEFDVSHEFNAVWKKNSVFHDEYRELIHKILS